MTPIYTDYQIKSSFLRFIPISFAIIGLVIHALGLLDLIPHPPFILDLLMFLIDLLAVYGLMKKNNLGILDSCYFVFAAKLYAALLGLQKKYIEFFYYPSCRIFSSFIIGSFKFTYPNLE